MSLETADESLVEVAIGQKGLLGPVQGVSVGDIGFGNLSKHHAQSVGRVGVEVFELPGRVADSLGRIGVLGYEVGDEIEFLLEPPLLEGKDEINDKRSFLSVGRYEILGIDLVAGQFLPRL
jgi:hypothetical protein